MDQQCTHEVLVWKRYYNISYNTSLKSLLLSVLECIRGEGGTNLKKLSFVNVLFSGVFFHRLGDIYSLI